MSNYNIKFSLLDFRFFVGIFLLIIYFSLLLLSFIYVPYSVTEIYLEDRFLNFSTTHWLGTDQFGRDFYSRLLVGTRNSILLTSLAVLLGSFIGTISGLFSTINLFSLGGKILTFGLSEINRLLFAFPVILTAILISSIYGTSGRYSLLAISIFNIPIFYYVTKNISQKIWNSDYVIFSLAIGNSKWSIQKLHIIPQIYTPLLIQFTIQWNFSLLTEASLSYLGLGIQPPEPSLGRIIYESQTFFYLKSSLILLPAVVIFLLILCFSYLGDYFSYRLSSKN